MKPVCIASSGLGEVRKLQAFNYVLECAGVHGSKKKWTLFLWQYYGGRLAVLMHVDSTIKPVNLHYWDVA